MPADNLKIIPAITGGGTTVNENTLMYTPANTTFFAPYVNENGQLSLKAVLDIITTASDPPVMSSFAETSFSNNSFA